MNGEASSCTVNLPYLVYEFDSGCDQSCYSLLSHVVTHCARLRRPPRFAWRAPRRAAASRQQGLTTLGKVVKPAKACGARPGGTLHRVSEATVRILSAGINWFNNEQSAEGRAARGRPGNASLVCKQKN